LTASKDNPLAKSRSRRFIFIFIFLLHDFLPASFAAAPAFVDVAFPADSANHSHRKATSGSTFVARRAGIQQASSATRSNSSAIAANVSGSVALVP
jgi:hypothetical protein